MVRLFGHHIAVPVAILVVCELCLFLLGLMAAVWVYPAFAHSAFKFDQINLLVIAGLAAINLGCLFAAGLYNRDAIRVGARLSLSLATATSLMAIAFAAYLMTYTSFHAHRFSNLYAVSLLAVGFQLILLFFIRAFFVNIFDVVGFKRSLLLLGEGPLVAKAKNWLAENERGYTDVIHYDSGYDSQQTSFWQSRPKPVVQLRSNSAVVSRIEKESPVDALPAFVQQHSIDEIVVATMGAHAGSVWDLLECRTRGVKVTDFLSFWERETGRINLDAIEPNWLVYSGGFRSNLVRRLVERSVDLVVSIFGLVLMSPVMAIVAVLIRLDSPGSVLYRQERIGHDDQPFEIIKFRSMFVDAEDDGAPQWAEFKDPRVTRVGAVLRRTRLDELPQLWNVLKGEMSLVGPRPERPHFVSRFGRQIPFYGVRHSVRPGITGWAQINFKYAASLEDTKRKLEYDLFYVKNRSVFLDLAILLQTLRIILWQQGAR